MKETKQLPDISCRPDWENCKLDYGIGIIGTGGVAHWAHFPTYKYADMNVVAIAELDDAARQEEQQRWQIDKAFKDYRQLLELDEVEIVDVTIHHDFNDFRLEVVKAAAEAGKHVLIQKPLTLNFQTAKEIVEVANANGVKLAVNQNFRWNPSCYGAKQLIDQGYIGKVQTAAIENITPANYVFDAYDEPAYDLIAFGIHSVDLFRFWLNANPSTVYAKTYNRNHLVVSQFPDNMQTSLVEMGSEAGGADDFSYSFRITGSEGVIKGVVGCHPFQKMPLDHLEVLSSQFPASARWQTIQTPPDLISLGERFEAPLYDLSAPYAGFLGAMGSLMKAISEDEEPEVSGNDNLNTLKYAFAPYESTKLNREVKLEELEKDYLYKKSGHFSKDEK
jgi:predicted dehydrogenase